MNLDDLLSTSAEEGNIEDYWYFKLLSERSILFNEECSQDIVEKIGMPLLKFDQDNSNDPVHLYINSEGGDVFSSLWICNIIDNYHKPLYIHVLGFALSMGFLLAVAGKNNPNVHTDCYPFSVFMLHSGSLSLSSDLSKAKSFMKFNNNLETTEKNYILTHTSIDEDTYEKCIDSDYWLTADQALEYHIVDSIIGVESDEK